MASSNYQNNQPRLQSNNPNYFPSASDQSSNSQRSMPGPGNVPASEYYQGQHVQPGYPHPSQKGTPLNDQLPSAGPIGIDQGHGQAHYPHSTYGNAPSNVHPNNADPSFAPTGNGPSQNPAYYQSRSYSNIPPSHHPDSQFHSSAPGGNAYSQGPVQNSQFAHNNAPSNQYSGPTGNGASQNPAHYQSSSYSNVPPSYHPDSQFHSSAPGGNAYSQAPAQNLYITHNSAKVTDHSQFSQSGSQRNAPFHDRFYPHGPVTSGQVQAPISQQPASYSEAPNNNQFHPNQFGNGQSQALYRNFQSSSQSNTLPNNGFYPPNLLTKGTAQTQYYNQAPPYGNGQQISHVNPPSAWANGTSQAPLKYESAFQSNQQQNGQFVSSSSAANYQGQTAVQYQPNSYGNARPNGQSDSSGQFANGQAHPPYRPQRQLLVYNEPIKQDAATAPNNGDITVDQNGQANGGAIVQNQSRSEQHYGANRVNQPTVDTRHHTGLANNQAEVQDRVHPTQNNHQDQPAGMCYASNDQVPLEIKQGAEIGLLSAGNIHFQSAFVSKPVDRTRCPSTSSQTFDANGSDRSLHARTQVRSPSMVPASSKVAVDTSIAVDGLLQPVVNKPLDSANATVKKSSQPIPVTPQHETIQSQDSSESEWIAPVESVSVSNGQGKKRKRSDVAAAYSIKDSSSNTAKPKQIRTSKHNPPLDHSNQAHPTTPSPVRSTGPIPKSNHALTQKKPISHTRVLRSKKPMDLTNDLENSSTALTSTADVVVSCSLPNQLPPKSSATSRNTNARRHPACEKAFDYTLVRSKKQEDHNITVRVTFRSYPTQKDSTDSISEVTNKQSSNLEKLISLEQDMDSGLVQKDFEFLRKAPINRFIDAFEDFAKIHWKFKKFKYEEYQLEFLLRSGYKFKTCGKCSLSHAILNAVKFERHSIVRVVCTPLTDIDEDNKPLSDPKYREAQFELARNIRYLVPLDLNQNTRSYMLKLTVVGGAVPKSFDDDRDCTLFPYIKQDGRGEVYTRFFMETLSKWLKVRWFLKIEDCSYTIPRRSGEDLKVNIDASTMKNRDNIWECLRTVALEDNLTPVILLCHPVCKDYQTTKERRANSNSPAVSSPI